MTSQSFKDAGTIHFWVSSLNQPPDTATPDFCARKIVRNRSDRDEFFFVLEKNGKNDYLHCASSQINDHFATGSRL